MSAKTERDKRKEQRLKELQDKKDRLRRLKEKNQTEFAPKEAGVLDLTSISNVQDLLKTLEETTIVPKTTPDDGDDDTQLTGATEAASPRRASPEPAALSPRHTTTSSAGAAHTTVRPQQLSIQLNVVAHDIAPKDVEVYSRGMQTEETWTGEGNEEIGVEEGAGDVAEKQVVRKGKRSSTVAGVNTVSTSTDTSAGPGEEEGEDEERSTKVTGPPPPPELNEIERGEIVQSADFGHFFNKATRTMERAIYLADKFNLTRDFVDDDRRSASGDFDVGQKVRHQMTLFDESVCKYRAVTDLTWSPKDMDLIAVSYSANETGISEEPDGCVCVWSLQNTLQRPESVLQCQSPVLSTIFAKYQPNIVIGGTYSGQIVLWDRRASRKTPIQRTPLSSIGHTHPVYSLAVLGTQNANNLVTISTDGRMCVWAFESLHQPLEVLELRNKQSKSVTGGGNVAPTCMAFSEGEVNEFFVGSEEATVYQAYRHGTKSGVYEQYSGHRGPITALDFHPAHGPVDFSDYFLTSSVDWSVKLWNKKNTFPLHSFEDVGEYVYDVAWSPIHPALFASADGTGSLCLWNLNEDPETPYARTAVGTGKALNSLSWAPSGKKIICGDATGSVYVYDISEIASPSAQEWDRLESSLKDLAYSSAATHARESEDADFI
jgi:dynein intermediate chain